MDCELTPGSRMLLSLIDKEEIRQEQRSGKTSFKGNGTASHLVLRMEWHCGISGKSVVVI